MSRVLDVGALWFNHSLVGSVVCGAAGICTANEGFEGCATGGVCGADVSAESEYSAWADCVGNSGSCRAVASGAGTSGIGGWKGGVY